MEEFQKFPFFQIAALFAEVYIGVQGLVRCEIEREKSRPQGTYSGERSRRKANIQAAHLACSAQKNLAATIFAFPEVNYAAPFLLLEDGEAKPFSRLRPSGILQFCRTRQRLSIVEGSRQYV